MTEREKMRRAFLARAYRIRSEIEQINRDEASYNENYLPPGEEPLSTARPEDIFVLARLDQLIADLEAQAP